MFHPVCDDDHDDDDDHPPLDVVPDPILNHAFPLQFEEDKYKRQAKDRIMLMLMMISSSTVWIESESRE